MRLEFFALSLAGALLAHAQPAKVTLEDLLTIDGGRGGRGGLTLTRDGKYFTSTRNEQVLVTPVAGGSAVTFASAPGEKTELNWSPDGKKIAYVSQGAVWVVAAGATEAKKLTEGKAGPGDPRGATDHFPRWSPGGKWILFETGRSGQNELYVVSEDGKTTNFIAATEIYKGADRLGSAADGGRRCGIFRSLRRWSRLVSRRYAHQVHGALARVLFRQTERAEVRPGQWARHEFDDALYIQERSRGSLGRQYRRLVAGQSHVGGRVARYRMGQDVPTERSGREAEAIDVRRIRR